MIRAILRPFVIIIMSVLFVYLVVACIFNLPKPFWIDDFINNDW